MPSEALAAVPHLTTALDGPLQQLESQLLAKQPMIEAWLRRQWAETGAPFYSSIDLRNAGFKLAPVDTNLFPAGFNNLNPSFLPLCIQAIQAAVESLCPTAANILLIPESHTRNAFYLESVATLGEILQRAGFQARVGSLDETLDAPQTHALPSGRSLVVEPLVRDGARVGLDGYDPCMVLLNNDLAGGRPAILENLEQPVVPPLGLGWSNRLKSSHFAYYQTVAAEFGDLVGIDPWLFDPLSRNCGEIDFMKREGEECLASNTNTLLQAIALKYREYGIDRDPFVVIKADAGTYGMGIMTAHSTEDVRALNRKQRTRMAASKGGAGVTRVILQEGVYTFETWNSAVAEPVVYMIDRFVVGGFYRVHTARGANENLNAPGMHFEPLAFADCCNSPDHDQVPDAGPNRFYAYGVIARLATLAAARELAEH
jgi:glutamate--cysteine ligase